MTSERERVLSSLSPLLLRVTGVVGALAVTGASRAAAAAPAVGRAEASRLAAPARRSPSAESFGQAGRRDPVVERDIFGAAARPPPANGTWAQDETHLALSTTVVDPEGGFAVAWLGHGTDRLTAVSVGDSVDGGVVVAIDTRTVVLQRDNGALTRVVMQGSAPLPSVHPSRPAQGSTSDRTAPQSGYRLVGLARGDLLFGHGLRDGDVLHAVAGVAVASRQSARFAIETARSVGAVEVDLTRDGRRFTLSLLLP